MKKLIRNFPTPTNVYIVGSDFKHEKETFKITDDYSSFRIQSAIEKGYMDTDGFVFVLTEGEFDNIKHKITDENQECTIINDFQGDLFLDLVSDETGESFLSGNVDLEDYIMHQMDDTDDSFDVILYIGNHKFKIVEINSLVDDLL